MAHMKRTLLISPATGGLAWAADPYAAQWRAVAEPSLWARGNGWVLMSIADTMEHMGRKHTILDDPASYEESSATAMFTYRLLKLVRLKVLPAAGTGPGKGDNYKAIKLGSETWGTGAHLMAGSEMDCLK